ncbi:hypothetical protein AB6E26_25950 [Vibrio splendidus]
MKFSLLKSRLFALLPTLTMSALALTGCAHDYGLYDIKVMSDYELCSTYKRHMHNKVQKQRFINEVNHRSRAKGEDWREHCTIVATNKVKYVEDL